MPETSNFIQQKSANIFRRIFKKIAFALFLIVHVVRNFRQYYREVNLRNLEVAEEFCSRTGTSFPPKHQKRLARLRALRDKRLKKLDITEDYAEAGDLYGHKD